ncbi:MAG: carbonic anhydrase [Pseudomonadota bacterium]
MISAREAFERLKDGNKRYVSGKHALLERSGLERRESVAGSQAPFATILGCSDSRVPAEIVFDEGLGDLFVIRVAGNVVAPEQTGSVEFAALKFGTPLVVVLGHSACGAVDATIAEMQQPAGEGSPNLGAIVDRVRPSIENLLASGQHADRAALVDQAVRQNIRHSVNRLRDESKIVEELMHAKKLSVIGAHYSLASGQVEFLDEPN